MLALFAVLLMILDLLGIAESMNVSVLALGLAVLLEAKALKEEKHNGLAAFCIFAGIFAFVSVMIRLFA